MTKIIAHRGASGYAPENTMEAFKLAIGLGAEGIETDVHLTCDGQVVIIHDEKIDRTSNGLGYVKDCTYEQLAAFNYNNHMEQYEFCKLPLLSDLLELVKSSGILLNIELKTDFYSYPGIEEKVVALVKTYGVERQIIYSSFNHYTLMKVKAIDPNARIGLLYAEGIVQPWDYATHIQADALHPFYANLQIPNYIQEAHQQGIIVNTWTVNKREDMKRFIEMQVDGLITNYPDLALAIKNGD
ncbi:MAG: glycerophosphodiester phosphodiesterase [Beduini sp.]|uniref:glycerophosphodiester phosphodiesterase n=1 Tax=Beduini sp. TaxID=1922300 RepID=UPI0011C7EF06